MDIKEIIRQLDEVLNEDDEKIKLDVRVDIDNGIKATTDNSIFVNLPFKDVLDLKDLLSNYAELQKLCKENKIKLAGKTKISDAKKLFGKYVGYVEAYNTHVEYQQEQWQELVKEEIYAPIADNAKVQDLIKQANAMEKNIYYRSSPVSEYESIYYGVERALNTVTDALKYNEQLLLVGI